MNWYTHSSKYLKPFFPSLVWDIPTQEKVVYLTFDDGPHPDITPYVLSVLKPYGFKATFFCIGENVVKHPVVYHTIESQGHAVGNHTFNHLNGFTHDTDAYTENVKKAKQSIDSKLFRPPYGRLKLSQINQLKPDYNIIMWSCLSGDFDRKLDTNEALVQLKKLTKPGAIVVFHDSLKAQYNLEKLLPQYCAYLEQEGYTSCKLS